MIKAIIWDVGGVLIENPDYKEFWEGVEDSEDLRLDFGTGKISREEFVEKGSKFKGVSEEEFLKRYKEAYWKGERNEGVIELYKKGDYKRIIFSDTNAIHQEYIQKIGKDIFDLADFVFLNKRKKYENSYFEILNECGLSPDEVIFIDDKKEYVEMADKVGMKGVLFEDAEVLREKLE